MQHNLKSLTGFAIGATNGEIGKVEALYFDDKSWSVRYLVVKTGSWLFGRSVLISPMALQKPDWKEKDFPTNLTKEQVQNSPDIDTQKPVSRQHEMELSTHYSWQPYWGSGFYAGGQWGVIPPAPLFGERVMNDVYSTEEVQNETGDLHLRSTSQVTGYHIHATDGEAGHVSDFIIDDTTWQIVNFVIDTHNWIGGKKLVIPVENIKEISWAATKVILDLSIAGVKGCSTFDESNYDQSEKTHSIPVNS
jgi:sporulation protein YlmC with PRC-barrel domain